MLNHAVEALEVFPYEATDAQVLGDLLFAAIGLDVAHSRAMDWYVINIRYGSVGYLGLENVSEVVMKYWYRISPSHQKGHESKCTEGQFEGGEVTQAFCEATLIVPDV